MIARFFLFPRDVDHPSGDTRRAPRVVSAWLPVLECREMVNEWQARFTDTLFIEYRD